MHFKQNFCTCEEMRKFWDWFAHLAWIIIVLVEGEDGLIKMCDLIASSNHFEYFFY